MDDVITLAHGAGGTVMGKLIKETILPSFFLRRALEGIGLDDLDDGASLKLRDHEIVVSLDSHTVSPLFFPGGDIGRLALAGTVNDVAVMGAKPIAVLDAVIVEEGFPISDLKRVLSSMNRAAREVPVAIIGGDIKVMRRGELDQMVIATCGIGIAERGRVVSDAGARPGDRVIISGTIGDHGIALMATREGLQMETAVKSDINPIWDVVEAALKVGGITAMKDPTRGGVSSALNEIAEKSSVSVWIDEGEIPVRDGVKAASEVLGIDPLEVTCEGKAVITVDGGRADDVVEAIRQTRHGRDARIIGEVRATYPGYVLMRTAVGGTRIIQKPVGEPIPRVC